MIARCLALFAAPAFVTAALLSAQAPPAAPSADSAYAGSAACQRCHDDEYKSWRRTLHVQMTKPIAEARVEGDFSPGAHLEQYGRGYRMEAKDGRYAISIAHDGGAAEKFPVDYTLGARRFQGYLSKLPDGRIYVLPVFWHNESRRWMDWKEIAPVPDHPAADLRQIWNITCVNCHATNLARNFDPKAKAYATSWTEMGVGCEACHGPGAAHIDVEDAWDRNPLLAPKQPTMADLRIFSPAKAQPRQTFDTCGYCHGNKNNAYFGFKPGDHYEDFALPFLISQPIPENDPQGDFWPDGRPSRFNRPQALTLAGCFRRGEATCTSCHQMHGRDNAHMLKVSVEGPDGRRTRESDALCTQCHADPQTVGVSPAPVGERDLTRQTSVAAALARSVGQPAAWTSHTHHAAESAGSRCVECHMSDVNWRLFTRRRDHTFQAPVPELTARYGVPNACNTCHEDRSPEWAADTMTKWYGAANQEHRRSIAALSDVIYRAGSGELSALPEVAKLAVGRERGMLIRASAAEFAGQLLAKASSSAPPPEAINALIGAASDPEPTVRASAIRSLAQVVDARTTAVIAAHLTDPIRIVRARAAEALLDRGVVSLEGAAGPALTRAQDEWADSLRTFNDDPRDQSRLGWLELSRGRRAAATEALTTAASLDPTFAEPHVYLGVLAARDGRFDDAVKQFAAAKSLQADYPNIDRLIEEAQKRR